MGEHSDHDSQISERISGTLSDDVFEGLQHEKSRQYIIKIIEDYAKHEDFINRVRKYAGQEMDSRLFISGKFWLTTILSAIISAIIGVVAGHFLLK